MLHILISMTVIDNTMLHNHEDIFDYCIVYHLLANYVGIDHYSLHYCRQKGNQLLGLLCGNTQIPMATVAAALESSDSVTDSTDAK